MSLDRRRQDLVGYAPVDRRQRAFVARSAQQSISRSFADLGCLSEYLLAGELIGEPTVDHLIVHSGCPPAIPEAR